MAVLLVSDAHANIHGHRTRKGLSPYLLSFVVAMHLISNGSFVVELRRGCALAFCCECSACGNSIANSLIVGLRALNRSCRFAAGARKRRAVSSKATTRKSRCAVVIALRAGCKHHFLSSHDVRPCCRSVVPVFQRFLHSLHLQVDERIPVDTVLKAMTETGFLRFAACFSSLSKCLKQCSVQLFCTCDLRFCDLILTLVCAPVRSTGVSRFLHSAATAARGTSIGLGGN